MNQFLIDASILVVTGIVTTFIFWAIDAIERRARRHTPERRRIS